MAKDKDKSFRSEGARAERKAMRAYLRRKLAGAKLPTTTAALQEVLDWVLGRQERYDKRKGGL